MATKESFTSFGVRIKIRNNDVYPDKDLKSKEIMYLDKFISGIPDQYAPLILCDLTINTMYIVINQCQRIESSLNNHNEKTMACDVKGDSIINELLLEVQKLKLKND